MANLDGFSQQNETESWKSSTKLIPYPPRGRGVGPKSHGDKDLEPRISRRFSPMFALSITICQRNRKRVLGMDPPPRNPQHVSKLAPPAGAQTSRGFRSELRDSLWVPGGGFSLGIHMEMEQFVFMGPDRRSCRSMPLASRSVRLDTRLEPHIVFSKRLN